MEEHTGKCGWADTKKGLIHHKNILKFCPVGNKESLKNFEMGSNHNSSSMDNGLEGIKTKAIRRFLPKPRQCDEPQLGHPIMAIIQFFFPSQANRDSFKFISKRRKEKI